METYTISEAAELTGLTDKSVRNRVDRGQLRVVKRDGLRRIPRSELKRAGLIRAEAESSKGVEPAPEPLGSPALVGQLLDRLERQASQLGELRALTSQAESLQDQRARLEAALENAREDARRAHVRVAELEARFHFRSRSRPNLEARLVAGGRSLRRLRQAALARLRPGASPPA